jgi:hypothetical protein
VGITWDQYRVKRLKDLVVGQSDKCVFYKGNTIFMIYVDDGIPIDPDSSKIKEAMLDVLAKVEVQDKGDLSDYLSVKVRKPPDGSIESVQMQLIDSILAVLKSVEHGGCNQAKTYEPHCKHDGKMNQDEFDSSWDYKSVVGKLNYLEKSAIGYIAISVPPFALYMSQTIRIHDEAVRRIGRYLLGTWDKGFLVQSYMQQSFECYVDEEYCGNWYPMYSVDPKAAKSRTEYVMVSWGPILWPSRLQSAFTLSIMEFKYVALLTDWRDVIRVMHLLKEFQDRGDDVEDTRSIKCKMFEHNSGVWRF